MFQLKRNEQRVIIFIVVILVVAAFTQHFLETKSQPPRIQSATTPTATPTIRPDRESDSDDSR
jgi:hypothetical protein